MNLKRFTAIIVLGMLLISSLPATAMSEEERQAQMQSLLLRMAKLSPHGTLDAKESTPQDREALERVKASLSRIDFLLEDVDDAYTVGDFEKATALLIEIQKDPSLNSEQRGRATSYMQAMEQERTARATEQVGRPEEPRIKKFQRDVLKKESAWNDILTYGGIAVGVGIIGVSVYLLTK